MAIYELTSAQSHFYWDETHQPALRIQSGDVVELDTSDASNGFIFHGAATERLAEMDLSTWYSLTGPIYVEGAQPGDVLAVEVQDARAGDWGWMCILPGFGLLNEEFKEPFLRTFDLTNGEYVLFRDDIKVPFDPFLGTMGVCPAGARGQGVMPPGNFGGNMDLRHLKKGSTVYYPVQVEGGLFSCGDGHAVQGDGEICVTAMECPMHARLGFTVIKDKKINAPQFLTPGPLNAKASGEKFYGTSGVGPDLMENAKMAATEMVTYISETYHMSRLDAYMLASLCADLRIGEIVDAGVFVVNAVLPLSVFGQ